MATKTAAKKEGDFYLDTDEDAIYILHDDKWHKLPSEEQVLKKFTGRAFRCVALEEKEMIYWANKFDIGGIYLETTVANLKEKAEILTLQNTGLVWHVDSDCFELV